MTWRKIVLIIFASFLVSFVAYFLFNRFARPSAGRNPAALYVESLDRPLTVVLENNIVGKTPFRSETLKEGTISLVLTSEEENSFRSKLSLGSGTLTVVKWGLGPSEVFSEGEIVWLEKTAPDSSLVVFGSPDGAEVRLDDAFLGTVPVSTEKVEAGDHAVRISKQGYKTRLVKIKVQEGYKLSIKFQLFLMPGMTEAPLIPFPTESRYAIRDFSTAEPLLYADTKNWVRGLDYLFKTAEASPSGEKKVDYFFDYQGRIFDQSGFKVSENSDVSPRENLRLGYLGRKSDGGVTEEAKKVILNFAQRALISEKKVEILPTVTGWLKVRSTPNITPDNEIAKVNVGEKVVFLGESGSWYQVKLPDGQTGWISAAFAKKL